MANDALARVWPYNLASAVWHGNPAIFDFSPNALERMMRSHVVEQEWVVLVQLYQVGRSAFELAEILEGNVNNVLGMETTAIKKLRAVKISTVETDIWDIGLSLRTVNALKAAGISTISDIRKLGWKDITKVRGLGKKSIQDLKDSLERLGISLEEE